MTGRACDIAIVGGGLAGGLIALALSQRRPELSSCLIESGAALGGNHRWSWFASDLQPAGGELMAALPATAWEAGYDVAFPYARRHLPTAYRSLGSADFSDALMRVLPEGTVRCGARAEALDAAGITLAGGERIAARAVIDARGPVAAPQLTGGWQVFMGRRLRTAEPHGIRHPVIMDATVPQLGGYRFVYVLPLGERELFVEDTYYQDTAVLDEATLGRKAR